MNEQDATQSEQFHLIKVLTAFAYYKRHSLNHNHRRRRDYLSLAEHHKQLIPHYLDKVNQVDDRIEENMKLIRDIVASSSMFLDQQPMIQASIFHAFEYTRYA
jgi:carnosine N-methyltransferase